MDFEDNVNHDYARGFEDCKNLITDALEKIVKRSKNTPLGAVQALSDMITFIHVLSFQSDQLKEETECDDCYTVVAINSEELMSEFLKELKEGGW